MACDTMLKPRQTISERKAEVKKVIELVARGIAAGRIKPVVDKKTGGVIFEGLTNEERDGVTDGCVLRGVSIFGGALANAAIARAEQIAGRVLDRKAIAQGMHSHDHGRTWHKH